MPSRHIITKTVLSTIGAAGVLVLAIAMPNLGVVFGSLNRRGSNFSSRQVQRALNRLQKQKLVTLCEKDRKVTVELTKAGQKRLKAYQLEDLKISIPKKWDSKWRIVIFDIPEQLKTNRKVFQEKLKDLGFKMLQKSVWIYPYPCEDEVDFLKEFYSIKKYVRIVTASEIDISMDLIKLFKLQLW